MLPLLRLRDFLLNGPVTSEERPHLRIVVVAIAETWVGFVVDQLLGQEETVVKPLSTYLRNVPGLAGATIGGDGRVRLILDPAALTRMADQAPESP